MNATVFLQNAFIKAGFLVFTLCSPRFICSLWLFQCLHSPAQKSVGLQPHGYFFSNPASYPVFEIFFSDWLMNSDLAKKLNTFNNCKGTLEKMRYLQKIPKYLELPVRLPENSDET